MTPYSVDLVSLLLQKFVALLIRIVGDEKVLGRMASNDIGSGQKFIRTSQLIYRTYTHTSG
jgi:hypothetical protein